MMSITPKPADVLCGRGPKRFGHPGNRKLRSLVTFSLERYNNCESRKQKSLLIGEIIQKIHGEGGRFLKYNKESDSWCDGGVQAARSRVGFAFRDALSSDKLNFKDEVTSDENAPSYLSQPPQICAPTTGSWILKDKGKRSNLISNSSTDVTSRLNISNEVHIQSCAKTDFDSFEPSPIGYEDYDVVGFNEAKKFLRNLMMT